MNVLRFRITNRVPLYDKTLLMEFLFEYEGRKINYSDQGSGTLIVLLHGYPETSQVWSDFALRLSKKFRVIVPDLPGHGKSDMFGDIHTMEFMAGIVNKLTEKLGTNKFFLAGHSLGGYVTLAFADLYPERLNGICLLHSHPFADTPAVVSKRENEISMVREGHKDEFLRINAEKMYADFNKEIFAAAIQRSVQIATGLSGDAVIAILRGMMARPSRLNVMEEGMVPLLWILGKFDSYLNYNDIQSRVHLPVNAEVMVMENSGHLAFIEEEEKTAKILEKFISSRSPGN